MRWRAKLEWLGRAPQYLNGRVDSVEITNLSKRKKKTGKL